MNRKQVLTNDFMTALREHFEAIERREVRENVKLSGPKSWETAK
jgi:hypothetical protein